MDYIDPSTLRPNLNPGISYAKPLPYPTKGYGPAPIGALGPDGRPINMPMGGFLPPQDVSAFGGDVAPGGGFADPRMEAPTIGAPPKGYGLPTAPQVGPDGRPIMRPMDAPTGVPTIGAGNAAPYQINPQTGLPYGGSEALSGVTNNPSHNYYYSQNPTSPDAYYRPNPGANREPGDVGWTPAMSSTYNNGQRVPFNPNVPITQTRRVDPVGDAQREMADSQRGIGTIMAATGGAAAAGGSGYTPGPEDMGGPTIGGYTPGAEDMGGPTGDNFFSGDVGADEFGNPTQGNFEGGPGTPSGNDFFNPGGTPAGGLPNMPPGASSLLGRLLGRSGGAGGGADGLLGGVADNPMLAALLAAGVMEHPTNPLTQPTVDAVTGAVQAGQRIQGLPIPGITPSFQRGIDTANQNVGAWRPYTDESAALTRSGAAPITGNDIQGYFNPYVAQALDPAARKINEAATAMKMADAAKSGARGAFGSERSDQLAKLGERNQLMSLGDLYGTGYGKAFDTALSAAGADKGRALTAGGAFQNLGSTVSGLGTQDVGNLSTAGGIETLPFTEEVGRSQTAGNVLSGAAAAGARAIGSTGKPSLLSNLTGAAGILDTLGRASGTNPSGTPRRAPNLPTLPGMPTTPSGISDIPSLPAPPPADMGSFPTDEFDW